MCAERTMNRTNTPPHDIMPVPYWECTKQFPNRHTAIWFRQGQQSQFIRGFARRGWVPEL
jgi:hypothetical protein